MIQDNIRHLQKGMYPNDCTFPLTQEQIDKMEKCRLVNPMVGKHHGLKIPDEYDPELSLADLKRVRNDVQHGRFPMWYMKKYYPFDDEWGEFPEEIPEPLALKGLSYDDPQGLANVVHMDNPMDMPLALTDWLFNPQHGQKLNVNDHTTKYVNFLETVPAINLAIAEAQMKSIIRCWQIKCYNGLIRPEERYADETGNPPFPFTAYYDDGCPAHGSFIAGHADFATSGGMAIVKKTSKYISHRQVKTILDSIYLWSMFRPMAGMHYWIDQLGAFVVSRTMRTYLRKEIVDMFLR